MPATLAEAIDLFLASKAGLCREVRREKQLLLGRLLARVAARIREDAEVERAVRASEMINEARDEPRREPLVTDLAREDLNEHLDHIRRTCGRVAPCKAAATFAQLGSFLSKNALVLLDPAAGIVIPKYQPRLGWVPSVAEVRSLLSAADPERVVARADLDVPPKGAWRGRFERYDERVSIERAEAIRDIAMLETLYGSGLRIKELLGLRLGDVDLAERTAFVAKGKLSKARVVPITKSAAEAIARYLASSRGVLGERQMRRRRTRIKPRSGALYLSTTGQSVMAQPWCERRLTPLLSAAKLPQALRPHRLRHACAVHLLEAGADILHISRLLGHESVAVTAVYLKLSLKELHQTLRAAHPRESEARS